MKREVLFLFVFLSLILCSVNTNATTEEDVAVSISVTAPPTLEIIKPTNGTYLIENNLKLEYYENGADTVWYNIDSNNNATVTGNTTFNTTSGQHTLYLHANNSEGTISKNVIFTINKNLFKIIDDNFDDEDNDDNDGNQRENKKGESTDFYDYCCEELQNLMGIKFHEPAYGKIEFSEIINLTDDNHP